MHETMLGFRSSKNLDLRTSNSRSSRPSRQSRLSCGLVTPRFRLLASLPFRDAKKFFRSLPSRPFARHVSGEWLHWIDRDASVQL